MPSIIMTSGPVVSAVVNAVAQPLAYDRHGIPVSQTTFISGGRSERGEKLARLYTSRAVCSRRATRKL